MRKGAYKVQIDFTEGRLAVKIDPSGRLLHSFIDLNNLAQDRVRVLKILRDHVKPGQQVFVGVVSSVDSRIETPEEVRDRTLEAAEFIPLEQLGTTDDCGFSPFCDDTSTTRDTAFAKIRARVLGTALASAKLGIG